MYSAKFGVSQKQTVPQGVCRVIHVQDRADVTTFFLKGCLHPLKTQCEGSAVDAWHNS